MASSDAHLQSRERPRLFPALMLVSGASYLFAITWGLPAPVTWAPDELVPNLVRDALNARFSGGWHTQYPTLHFFFISLIYAPFSLLDIDANYALSLTGRLLSVVMALGCLFFLYRIGRRLLTPAWTLVAVALFAFTPQTVYYAKIANLDIPYTFWLLFSLYVFSLILENHRTDHYILFSVVSMAAICTKEQAYGFYVLLVPLLFLSRYRSKKVKRITLDRCLLYSFLAALTSFLLFQNILFHSEGFIAHVELITGEKFRGYRMFPPTLSGHWGFFLLSIEQVAFVASIPVLLFAVFGVLLSLKKRYQHCWLLLPIISYQIFLLHVVLYSFDRFYLPVVAVLSLFAAVGLRSLSTSFPVTGKLTVSLLIAFQFARGTELNLMMNSDARYRAEAWMAQNVSTDRIVGTIGQRRYLPRHSHHRIRKTINPWSRRFQELTPALDCILLLYTPPRRVPPSDPTKRFLTLLKNGKLGLQRVFAAKENVLGTLFFNPKSFLGHPQFSTSNLSKISPETRVYSHGERCQLKYPVSPTRAGKYQTISSKPGSP